MTTNERAVQIADDLCVNRNSADWRPTYHGALEALDRTRDRFMQGIVCGFFLAAAVRIAEFLIS